MFIEILFKMLLFKGGVLIYTEHCILSLEYIALIEKATSFLLELLSAGLSLCSPRKSARWSCSRRGFEVMQQSVT